MFQSLILRLVSCRVAYLFGNNIVVMIIKWLPCNLLVANVSRVNKELFDFAHGKNNNKFWDETSNFLKGLKWNKTKYFRSYILMEKEKKCALFSYTSLSQLIIQFKYFWQTSNDLCGVTHKTFDWYRFADAGGDDGRSQTSTKHCLHYQ